jgi:hypothetical protein
MRPVNEAAPVVPHELTLELNVVADPEILHARRDVDVVHDQNGLTRRKPHEEPLVPVALRIVGQHARHDAVAVDANVSRVRCERARDARVVRRDRSRS